MNTTGTASSQPGTPSGGVPLLAVVIGASAGGPTEIQAVLEQLPESFPAAIAICQHMTEGATAPWAERLNELCRLEVVEASPGDRFLVGHVYIAPSGRHMQLLGPAHNAHISLLRDFGEARHVPSIDVLMSSVAEVFGSRALGVLLSGMGADGAKGMLAILEAGGRTISQSAESSPFTSMPLAATELGAASEQVDLKDLAAVIQARVAGTV